MHYPIRVLFLCTGNSARSQMAEGFLRFLGGQYFEAYSAGTHPKGLNPFAVKVMSEYQIDISGHRSKDVNALTEQSFDFVITVCDNARDNCPIFQGKAEKRHWRYPDPAAVEGNEEQCLKAFREVAADLKERLSAWVTALQNDK
ncbi:MAG: arsenate reductase ArsC [Candidatus Parabeggiatoa sp. nov. 2]|nr:MAG: protein-tyrosine-phosphatase [Beggiatoa sp. 4572_84]RKZ46590.1 MAG: arsenate reductase ArsC [Gammaproteobacteria bacterium]